MDCKRGSISSPDHCTESYSNRKVHYEKRSSRKHQPQLVRTLRTALAPERSSSRSTPVGQFDLSDSILAPCPVMVRKPTFEGSKRWLRISRCFRFSFEIALKNPSEDRINYHKANNISNYRFDYEYSCPDSHG